MNELFMPFSRGTRACMGINLANMELKLVTAGLLKDIVLDWQMGRGMIIWDLNHHSLIFPKVRNEN